MASHPKRFFTPAEYLAIEKDAQYKSEYFEGEIFAMTGGSKDHINIVANLTSLLLTELEDTECEVYPNEMRVRTPDTTFYTYPDIAVVCGNPELEDGGSATLVNPSLIIEVLSPSTESYDRTRKFAAYRRITSLQEYVLVAQAECRVTVYSRQPDDQGLFSEFSSLDDVVHFDSINCDLKVKRIYRRIQFPSQDEVPTVNPS